MRYGQRTAGDALETLRERPREGRHDAGMAGSQLLHLVARTAAGTHPFRHRHA